MRFLAAAFLALALTACAEITKFEKSDGTAYYYVNCENTLRVLETCSFAVRRTCPGGYYQVKATRVDISADDPLFARCNERNEERKENNEPLETCVRKTHNEAFFACK